MASYKVTINTDSYVCHECSKKNWEPGTMNDYMIALNGWNTTEYSLREVGWRLAMFRGQDWLDSEYDPQKGGMSHRYEKWLNKKCNWIKFHDRLCNMDRKHRPSGYGFMQGYFDDRKYITELKEKGIVTIPFSALYDSRQYYTGQNGCFMCIVKVS